MSAAIQKKVTAVLYNEMQSDIKYPFIKLAAVGLPPDSFLG